MTMCATGVHASEHHDFIERKPLVFVVAVATGDRTRVDGQLVASQRHQRFAGYQTSKSILIKLASIARQQHDNTPRGER